MNVRFLCPACQCPERLSFAAPAVANAKAIDWQCPACDHRMQIPPPDAAPTTCSICSNHELYKKKNFPHWLGLTILTSACLGFLFFMRLHEPFWAWTVLLGSAAFDGLLFMWVGDAIVCYRCAAHYHGVEPGPEHKPFELVVAERYRQERLRREELNKK